MLKNQQKDFTLSYTIDQIELLAEKFRNQTLLKEEWTHHSHLIVALWFVSKYDFYEAVCRLKSGIIQLNAFHKTENTSSSGYHETLTIFWAKIIHLYISSNQQLPLVSLVNNFLNSGLSSRSLPFEFYDKNELLSSEYRCIYGEPKLKEINKSEIESILNNQ